LLALGVLGAVLYSVPAVRQVDLQWQGVLTRVVSVRSAPENVTIIDIDERSLHEIGPWPWPRPVLAQLSERLRERGARLQVWDLFFSQPTPADTALIAQLGTPRCRYRSGTSA
jgi:adenylate cyclase